MPPSPRYTVRLPPALDALVQARVCTGLPFAVLIREALSAYLADTPPTAADRHADTPPTGADTTLPTHNPAAAFARIHALRAEGWSLAQIAARSCT